MVGLETLSVQKINQDLQHQVALDVIGDGNRLKQIIRDKDKKALKKLLEKQNRPEAVLGVVEYMLNVGAGHTFFDTCRYIIDEALDIERDRVDLYDDPEARRRVLSSFKKRIQGKK